MGFHVQLIASHFAKDKFACLSVFSRQSVKS